LGATSRDIVRLVLVQAGFLIFAGSCLGVAGAFAVNLIYRASYPGLSLPGGWLQVIIAFVLCLAGLGAAYLPARRVGRTNPVSALRSE
jgi:ABC-type antimicrobial peptide transport system permease subunit